MASKSVKGAKKSFGFFGNLSLFFVDRPRFTATLLIAIIGFGFLSYTTLIRREGFPPIDIPISLVQGVYFVDDATMVDEQVAKPLQESIAQVSDVEKVSTTASDNFLFLSARLGGGVNASEVSNSIQSAIDNTELPPQAQVEILDYNVGKYFGKYDVVISVYSTEGATATELEERAATIAEEFNELETVETSEVDSLFREGVNPATGQVVVEQVSFSQVGLRESPDAEVVFYRSAVVGLTGHAGDELDIFKLADEVEAKVAELNASLGDGYMVTVSADFTAQVSGQISSLQNNVVTALIAILIISALLIGWRVSILMAIFVVSVLAVSVGVLNLMGYTLNTITLFALVLALGLFVDDATIISESIAARKSKYKGTRNIIGHSISSVGSASFAGTFTTILVFAPLLFISGILGEFIVAMPVTVIIALLTSLTLSLTLIPFLSQYTILTKKNIKRQPSNTPFYWLGIAVKWASDRLSNMIRTIKTNKKIGIPYAAVMFGLSIAFIAGAGYFASQLGFNIFPPSKDTDQVQVLIDYEEGISIKDAQGIADEVNEVVSQSVGAELVAVSYGGDSLSNASNATLMLDLTNFRSRDIMSPEIIEALKVDLEEAQIVGASFSVRQLDPGPPVGEYPFSMQIFSEDAVVSQAAADDVEAYLQDLEITLVSGEVVHVTRTDQGDQDEITRSDGSRYVTVLAGYDSDEVSQLLQLTRTEIKKEYTPERLEALGLTGDIDQDFGFDFGQESENEESFAALGPAGLIALGAMFILLLVQFRSVLKPLLIFLAIPFSLLGVTAGLYFTDNSLSFFAMVGFIGLIGIAVNNTILLTDAANRFKKKGHDTVDAIADGLQERFRPLITTTTTTIVALTPLAISDPFWEPLAVTIMFGLLSSTILVVLSFPVYYILFDSMAVRTNRAVKKLFKRK